MIEIYLQDQKIEKKNVDYHRGLFYLHNALSWRDIDGNNQKKKAPRNGELQMQEKSLNRFRPKMCMADTKL